MKATSIAFGYRTVSFIAIFLLWGFYALNGGLKANLLAAWNGRLSEDIPLKTDYTGIFVIDYPISLLVTFFYFGTNGSDEGYQLMVLEAYSTLQSSFVWLLLETMRPGSRPWTVATPLIFFTLSQVLGGAISLPFYYASHIIWADGTEILRAQDYDAASALPFSFLLGAILPAILGLAPTWNGPESRSPEVHQKYLAFFQVDPLWVVLTQTLMVKLFRSLRPTVGSTRAGSQKAIRRWTRASYLLAAASSAIGRVYAAARVYTSNDEGANLVRLLVPYPPEGPTGGIVNPVARGAFLYLQFDIPIFGLTSMAWAFLLLTRMPNRPRMSNLTLASSMLIGYLTIGPGATVSLALYAREELLPEKAKRAEKVALQRELYYPQSST